jgi:hypothetical protein
MFIPDPTISIPDPGLTGHRIPDPDLHFKNFKYFQPKKLIYLVLKNKFRDIHPGCWIWIFFRPRVKKAPDPGSGIRIRNTALYRRELILSVLQVGDDDESDSEVKKSNGSMIPDPDPQHCTDSSACSSGRR